MEYIVKEEWEPIEGFPGYMVSSDGRVISHKYGYWRELRPYLGKNGYFYVNLRDGVSTTHKYIHRLVAEAYIPNPYNKRTINHIDGDKTNNDVENLEWATYQENSKHAYAHHLSRLPDMDVIKAHLEKPVIATNMDTGETLAFGSQREAAARLNMTPPHVNKALRGSCAHAKRYTFRYLTREEYENGDY